MPATVPGRVTSKSYLGSMALPLRKVQPIICAACENDLQHCHGTAIVVDETTHICSDDPDCIVSIDEHWFASFEGS